MRFCSKCGKEIHEEAFVCIHCGCKVERRLKVGLEKNKWITLLLWLFLGGFGGHHFYTGNYAKACGYILSVTVLSWLIVPPIIIFFLLIWDLVEILTGEINGVTLDC